MPFQMVWSVLLLVLAQKTTFWLVEILYRPIKSFHSMVFQANTRNKMEHTMWKSKENCARKWCLFPLYNFVWGHLGVLQDVHTKVIRVQELWRYILDLKEKLLRRPVVGEKSKYVLSLNFWQYLFQWAPGEFRPWHLFSLPGFYPVICRASFFHERPPVPLPSHHCCTIRWFQHASNWVWN